MGVRELFIPFLFLLASLHFLVHAQSPSSGPAGFVSIDCGKPRGYNEVDAFTGLTYTSDFDFTDTGKIYSISSEFLGKHNSLSDDLRSFPNGSRNCYTIRTVQQGNKYLVRASFMYGNYDGMNSTPRFDLYLGVNFWRTVSFSGTSQYFYNEVIAMAASSSMVVCLVNTGGGTPFISGLELRSIHDYLYREANASQALVIVQRLDIGGSKSHSTRYPNDTYDRIWWGDSTLADATISTTSKVNIENFYYKPPSNVMATARVGADGMTILNYNVSLPSRETMRPFPRFHIFRHFAELKLLGKNETRIFDIYTSGESIYRNYSPSYLSILTVYSINPVKLSDRLEISLVKTENSTLPPILNALEVYLVMDISELETNIQDVEAIMDIKGVYGLPRRNWVGDPCAPRAFAWDGLNCSYDDATGTGPRITSLQLSSSNISGEIAKSLENLTDLKYLDLSNNNLTGQIPEFLANLPRLTFLNLRSNHLSGSVPGALLEKSTNQGSLVLSVEGNPDLCTSIICSNTDARKKIKVSTVIAAIVGSVVGILTVVSIAIWRIKKSYQILVPKDFEERKEEKDSLKMGPIGLENNQFTYAKLIRITNQFHKEIGKGGFGPVYHGVLEGGCPVAVKMLSSSSSQGVREFKNEAHLLTRIHHKYLVPLVGYCTEMKNLALVYEYMEEGNLHDHLSGKAGGRVLLWKERLRIAIEAAQGLEYLHKGCKPAIVHRDVKSSNILLTSTMEAKISDFGLSKIFGSDSAVTHVTTKCIGTPGYVDPEYYAANKLTEKSDVYSFGIVLLELITGLPAVVREANEENTPIMQWVNQRLQRGDISEIVDPRLQGEYSVNSAWKAAEVALACAAPSSANRPSMSELLPLLSDCMELEVACDQNADRSELDNSANKISAVEIPGVYEDVVTELLPR